MDVTKLLEKDHRAVEALFARFEAADYDAEAGRVYREISDRLWLHSRVEEQVLYPAAEDVAELKEDVVEARTEHERVKETMREIDALEPTAEEFRPKVKVLRELVEHHVKEEEREFFPKTRKALPGVQLELLGREIQERMERALGEAAPA